MIFAHVHTSEFMIGQTTCGCTVAPYHGVDLQLRWFAAVPGYRWTYHRLGSHLRLPRLPSDAPPVPRRPIAHTQSHTADSLPLDNSMATCIRQRNAAPQ